MSECSTTDSVGLRGFWKRRRPKEYHESWYPFWGTVSDDSYVGLYMRKSRSRESRIYDPTCESSLTISHRLASSLSERLESNWARPKDNDKAWLVLVMRRPESRSEPRYRSYHDRDLVRPSRGCVVYGWKNMMQINHWCAVRRRGEIGSVSPRVADSDAWPCDGSWHSPPPWQQSQCGSSPLSPPPMLCFRPVLYKAIKMRYIKMRSVLVAWMCCSIHVMYEQFWNSVWYAILSKMNAFTASDELGLCFVLVGLGEKNGQKEREWETASHFLTSQQLARLAASCPHRKRGTKNGSMVLEKTHINHINCFLTVPVPSLE